MSDNLNPASHEASEGSRPLASNDEDEVASQKPSPQVPDRCPHCHRPYDMTIQVGMVRCCLECGLVVNFADPRGLERAMASCSPAVPSGAAFPTIAEQEHRSFWRRRLRPRHVAAIVAGLIILCLLFWGTSKAIRVSHPEAMEHIRRTYAGPPPSVVEGHALESHDTKEPQP